MSKLTWILIRHAHRDTSNREDDNGLRSKGEEQAKKLGKYFKKRFGSEMDGAVFLTSPKKRCIQTLKPIGECLSRAPTIDERLSEQRSGESEGAFERRIAEFLNAFMKDESELGRFVIVCSHGDWLPHAVQRLCGAIVSPKKGSWTEISDGELVRVLTPDDL
jgi:broad specificity phosphatase PhoE